MRQSTTSSGLVDKLREVKKLVELRKENKFEKCVEIALGIFNDYFDHEIRNLLLVFPHDAKDKSGQPFWSGPKRAPNPITFNPADATHMNFIISCANLIGFNLGLEPVRDVETIKKHLSTANVKAYEPKKIKVLTPEEEKELEAKRARGEPIQVEETQDDEGLA